VFGALEPPEAEEEEEAEAAVDTRPRAPGRGSPRARRTEQTAARWPAQRPAGSRAHNRAHRGKEIQKLGADYGLDARLFHQAFVSFRNYIMQSHSLDVDIHIILNDICFSAAHVDDLFPFFLRHAKQIFPVLECKDDLRKISDLRIPPNWYPEARAIQRKIIFHSGPTNSGKTYHAIQK